MMAKATDTLVIKMQEILGAARVLVVNQQHDPQLLQDLESILAWKVQGYSIGDGDGVRKIAAAAEAIRTGRYGLVVGTTGLFGHRHDHALASAAKATNTLYVRVNRGRVGNIIREVARMMGIQ